jgi:hypothetical protein
MYVAFARRNVRTYLLVLTNFLSYVLARTTCAQTEPDPCPMQVENNRMSLLR